MSSTYLTKQYAMGERRVKNAKLADGTQVKIIVVSGKRRDQYMNDAMGIRDLVAKDGINMDDNAAVLMHLRSKYAEQMNDIVYQFLADSVCGENTNEPSFSLDEMRSFPNDLTDELWELVQIANRLKEPSAEKDPGAKTGFFDPKKTETGSDLPVSSGTPTPSA